MNRRQILLIGGGVAVLGAAGGAAWFLTRPEPQIERLPDPAEPADPPSPTADADDALSVQPGERVLGEMQAPITLIDYSSLTCPHCAAFHTETLPRIKQEWVDTGRVRVVYRHFPLDQLALAAALAAECIEQDKAYFGYLDVLFERQMQWARAEDPLAELRRLAGLAGLSPERFDECVTDQQRADGILRRSSWRATSWRSPLPRPSS
jgi:protein-disulfide isomerase